MQTNVGTAGPTHTMYESGQPDVYAEIGFRTMKSERPQLLTMCDPSSFGVRELSCRSQLFV
ncbi:MAG TPA: hypothetical protein DDW52_03180 [Planctomycetaceae bacterium]|nr:hypothetical protein [Planctomycetaceae bacterium]